MKKTVLMFIIALASAGVAAAQQAPAGTLTLTLDQAIGIALDDNPTIVVAGMEIERQRYVKRETIGAHLPQVSIGGQYTRAIVKSELGGGISFDPDNTIAAAATVNVPLFVPAVYKGIRVNEQQLRAAVEAARGSRIVLVNEVRKAYYGILLAQQALEVMYASRDNIASSVDDIRTKYENGLASEYDLVTIEVQLGNMHPRIVEAENQIDIARRVLRMYLDLPDETGIAVSGRIEDMADGVGSSTQAAMRGDVAGNSDLRQTGIQIDLLKRQLQLSRTQRMPVLSAFGNFNLSGRDPINFSGLGMGGGSSAFMWTHPISAGVSLQIPIFAGLTNVNRERQLKNTIGQLEIQRDYQKRGVDVQLNTALGNLRTATETMTSTGKTIDQAQKSYDISRARYNAGMGTVLELNSAELTLTNARLSHSQAMYDYLTAQADYDMVVGKEE